LSNGYDSPIMQKFVSLAKRNFAGAKAKKSVHKLHK
jgi:hypothetical protein